MSEPVEAASCPDFLALMIEVDVRTLDGAIEASAVGEAVQWRHGFEDKVGDAADQLYGHAYADLSDVTGDLTLDPPGGDSQTGELTVGIDFTQDTTEGSIWPTISVEQDDGMETYRYSPLQGQW